MKKGYLENLKTPVVGLSPMDGVTDAPFRYLVSKYSRPSVVFTEFVNVEGLARGNVKKMPAFYYDEIERPIVAQIFGCEVESFYKAAVLACALGFDGVDINMGCPAKKVEKKGSGAGLIKTPKLAAQIVYAVQRGVKDWSEGISLEKAGVHEDLIKYVEGSAGSFGAKKRERLLIPVSVKTRIGYDKIVTEEWISRLIETGPDLVSLHGRTLKQMYMGEANWVEIAKAATLCREAGVMVFGNGDIKSMEDAVDKINEYGVDGVLVGRAALGNPWLFGGEEPLSGEPGKPLRIEVAMEHCKNFKRIIGDDMPFHTVKKHLAWYLRDFDGARELRAEMMKVENFEEAEGLLNGIEK